MPAADKLVRLLKKVDKSAIVTGIVETVEGAINLLQEKTHPDLILMDIQLDDGSVLRYSKLLRLTHR